MSDFRVELGIEGVQTLPMHIDGEWETGSDGTFHESVNPFTGEVWSRVPEATEADVDRAVRAARAALDGEWGDTSATARSALLRALAEAIAANAEHLARIETIDNGKLIRETEGVVAKVVDYVHHFAGAADKLRGETIPTDQPNYLVYTVREPIGVVAAIVPWNAPLMLLAMKITPALAAGCTVVVKTAEQTSASALEIARLASEAGFPPGVLNVVTGSGANTGRALVRHPLVSKVTFTGSTASGVRVMQDAAEHLAPVTLELGGKSPNIVFADADLDGAVNGAVAAVFAGGGQMCIAGSRLLVEAGIREEFVARLAERAGTIRLGDPLDPASEMGPLATREQRDRVLEAIATAKSEGAKVAAGGGAPSEEALGEGYFVEPTILVEVESSMAVARNEVFGPVVSVFEFDSEEEAIALANDTIYGLSAGVWTQNLQRAHRVAGAIQAGTVWVNSYRMYSPNVPFGGFGASGFGKENGEEVLRELTRVKTVWVELAGASRDPFKIG